MSGDRADRVILKTLGEFMRMVEQYVSRYGEIDLIYRER